MYVTLYLPISFFESERRGIRGRGIYCVPRTHRVVNEWWMEEGLFVVEEEEPLVVRNIYRHSMRGFTMHLLCIMCYERLYRQQQPTVAAVVVVVVLLSAKQNVSTSNFLQFFFFSFLMQLLLHQCMLLRSLTTQPLGKG